MKFRKITRRQLSALRKEAVKRPCVIYHDNGRTGGHHDTPLISFRDTLVINFRDTPLHIVRQVMNELTEKMEQGYLLVRDDSVKSAGMQQGQKRRKRAKFAERLL